MQGTTMVVIIVFISVGFSVLGSMHKRHIAFKNKMLNKENTDAENNDLQQHIRQLETRVEILEKIVTDEGYDIQKEINRL